MEKFGLIGLPNAGKSSLFNALTGGHAVVAPHPFSTTETSLGVAHVPDDRLDRLSVMSASQKTVYATAECVDIAGLVAGAAGGEGMGNRFLAGVREVDALLLVLRAFEDDGVPGESNPLDALQVLELELVLADAESAENQLSRRKRAAKGDKSLAGEVAALEAALAQLHGGTPIYRSKLSAEQRVALRPFFLLTAKPVLGVVNIGEDQLAEADALAAPVADALGKAGEVLAASVQLEAETARLEPAERAEMFEGLGLGAGALPRVVRAAYDLLGLHTFLTTGDKESRAWTFRAGAKAPECAGVIHTDLQRGFIRAEVIRWDELLTLGSWNAAKDAGKLRIEGKDYVVQDGDVLEVRFNV
jgi:ribosome-binding ATPase